MIDSKKTCVKTNRCFISFVFFLFSISGLAQWSATPSPTVAFRYDDIYFITPSMGWAVNYATSPTNGKIIKTTNGGLSWQTVLSSSGARFRDIAFTDSLHGWVGTLMSGLNPQDTAIMYQTVDGGITWTPVQNFPGPRPAGICGMCVVNDSTVYACGRYDGPTGFYKTTNNGQTWSYTDMSSYAGGLVDIYFTTPDSGFVVGSSGSWVSDSGRVLFTADAGLTWQVRHTSAHNMELCWKISFPSKNIGYVSLESFRGTTPQYFLKTIDGGATWQDMNYAIPGNYSVQGIGFINDTVGWIGGDYNNYKTTDGGVTWSADNWGSEVNRFRFFSDTLGYAAGLKIYKFDFVSVSVMENQAALNNVLVAPNPFASNISIAIPQAKFNKAIFSIKNTLGQTIITEQANNYSGDFTKTMSLDFLPGGIYFLDIIIDDQRSVKKIIKE
jgi:photosystem II stability/assembly factor-like uncharacterized protein